MAGQREISADEAADMIETMALDLFAVCCTDPAADTAIKAARFALLAYVMALRKEMATEKP